MSENMQTKTVKAFNLHAGDKVVRYGKAYTVSDAFKHYRTGRIVVDLLGTEDSHTPTYNPMADVEVVDE